MSETSSHVIPVEEEERPKSPLAKYGTYKTPVEEELVDFIGSSGIPYKNLIVLYICTLYTLIVTQVLIFEAVRLQTTCRGQILGNHSRSYIAKHFAKDYYTNNIFEDVLPMREKILLASKGTFCEDLNKYHHYILCFSYSMIVSPFLTGMLADIYGRKMVLLMVCVASIFGQLLLIIPWNWIAIPSALISSALAAGNQFVGFLLLIEISSDRVPHSVFILFLYVPFSGFIVYALSYILQHAIYMIFLNAVSIAIMLMALWFFTESPRWLILAGYHEEAWLAVKRYNKQATQEIFDSCRPKTTIQLARNIFNVFKTPIYSQRIFFVFVATVCTAVTSSFILQNYKLSYLNSFENGVIISIAEVLTFIPIVLCAARYGKRNVTCVLLLFQILLNCLLLMRHKHMTEETVAMVIMIAVSAVNRYLIAICRFYMIELFPTLQRCTALGFIATGYHIAYILQLYNHTPKEYTGSLASVLVLISSIVCVLFITLLPNAKNPMLPDTPLEGLHFVR